MTRGAAAATRHAGRRESRPGSRPARPRTTAEGVETEDQMQRLLAQGCGDAQGFLIARPVAAGAIQDTIARLRDAAARQEART
jgi:EAL domain-containing protein (putative c-di-GMP-specific phosphodiesterase class I)